MYIYLYMYVYLYMATHIKWAYIPWNSLWFRILKVYSCHFHCFRMGIVHCHLFLSHFSILQLYFHDLLLSEISRALTCLYQTIWLITRSTQHQRHRQTVFGNLDGIRRGLANETEPLGVVFIVFQLLSWVRLFCNPMGCSASGSSVSGILQARILEWVAMPFSRGSSPPRDHTHISCIPGRFSTAEPPGKSKSGIE